MNGNVNNQPLTFTISQQKRIDRHLLHLADQVAAPLVMLADISGQLVLYRGRLPSRQSTGLAALAAASFAANLEIGKFLGLQRNFECQLLEGKIASLYTLTVGQELLLIIAFTNQTTLGIVRLFARQTQHELLPIVQEAETARQKAAQQASKKLSSEFQQALQTQLDELFSGES